MHLIKRENLTVLKGIDLDSYDFSHVFVDPPRAGIDEKSLTFLKRFDTIIYISCNPQTLKRDIEFLEDYEIEDFILFDQFPHTLHVEAGAILKREFKLACDMIRTFKNYKEKIWNVRCQQ